MNMGPHTIPVDRQRPFALRNASIDASGDRANRPKGSMGPRIVGPQPERLDKVGLGRAKPRQGIVGQPTDREVKIEDPAIDQGVYIGWINFEGAIEISARRVDIRGGMTSMVGGKPQKVEIHRVRVRMW